MNSRIAVESVPAALRLSVRALVDLNRGSGIPGSESIERCQPGWWRTRKMRGPCQRKLVCGKVVEADAEGEPALRGGVELLDEVGRADEGQRVAFHPGQHFIDLADLPAALSSLTAIEEAVCFIDQQQ